MDEEGKGGGRSDGVMTTKVNPEKQIIHKRPSLPQVLGTCFGTHIRSFHRYYHFLAMCCPFSPSLLSSLFSFLHSVSLSFPLSLSFHNPVAACICTSSYSALVDTKSNSGTPHAKQTNTV